MLSSVAPESSRAPRLGDRPPASDRARPWWMPLAAAAALLVPLVIALVSLRRPVWTPVLDLAMTELRVRDVGGRHTPLIGLPGRIGTLQEQGSHPGPLSFYALAPVYRLLGSTSWSLQVGTLLVHASAIATALWIAARRGGTGLVWACGFLIAAVSAGYGGGVLTEPWNPYLPLMWWVVVLLAAWSVLCGDLPLLPVLVLAASFCAQTHVPYLGLGLGVGALGVAGVLWHLRRNPEDRARALRWGGGAVALGLLLWLPPTVDQIRHDPGNYRQLVDHFTSPPEEPEGLDFAWGYALEHLDVTYLVRSDLDGPGGLVTAGGGSSPSRLAGVALVGALALTTVLAIRLRRDALVALHVVVWAAIALMVWSISRIFGEVWYYLTLWGWAIGYLGLIAIGWTLAVVLGDRWSPEVRAQRARLAGGALVAVTLLFTVRFAVAAGDSTHADQSVATELAAVVDAVDRGLRVGEGDASGTDGRYLVTWSDAYHIGSQGFGLLNELERRGFDVGVEDSKRAPATVHRVLASDEATARVHLANGSWVERYAEVPGAVEVARHDPRDPDERAEQERLRADLIEELRALGLDDVAQQVDDNLFGASVDARVPDELRPRMARMLEIGAPMAVFVLPPDAPVL